MATARGRLTHLSTVDADDLAGIAYHAFVAEERRIILCYHCGAEQSISPKALTLTCTKCHKPLRVEDVTIKRHEARRVIETVGVVLVEKKGAAITDRIICGGMIARGRVKGTINSRGPVLVGPEAEIKGDVIAPSLAVGAGAVLNGQYDIGRERKEAEAAAAAAEARHPQADADAP